MKTILIVILAALLLASTAWAETLTFTWDANTESDLAEYRLYQRSVDGSYPAEPVATIPAGTETVQLTVPDGKYFWRLTAVDTSGFKSEPSKEVDNIPPGAPKMFIITQTVTTTTTIQVNQ